MPVSLSSLSGLLFPSSPLFLLSLCLYIIVPLFYFQPSALFLKENSWAAGVTEEYFLTTLQIPHLDET